MIQYSGPPLYVEDTFQDTQWISETWYSTEPYVYNCPLVSSGDWFQDTKQVPKSVDAQVPI